MTFWEIARLIMCGMLTVLGLILIVATDTAMQRPYFLISVGVVMVSTAVVLWESVRWRGSCTCAHSSFRVANPECPVHKGV